MANKPSHLQVIFARHTHVRKEHIAGEQAAQTKTDLMVIVRKGEAKKIMHDVAMDLVIGGTCLIDSQQNREAIEEIRAAVKEENKRLEKKAA